jgi:spoIIIJ-associated protein
MSHRFEGRSLEEALEHAAQTLGVERSQLTYHVLLEKRGFLGGVKRIVLEADVNQSAPPPPAPSAAPVEPYDSAPPRAARERSGGGDAGGGGRGSGGGRGGNRGGGGGGGRGRDSRGGGGGGGNRRGGGGGGDRGRGRGRGESDLRVGDFETFMGEIPEQGPESDSARLVREWIEDALVLSRITMTVRTEENETQIWARLYGSDGRLLVDRHGELLDAVQVLANKALVGRKVEKEIELDCQDFKAQRSAELVEKALAVADRVRSNGREELLPAMSPIERRIVHIALREDPDVTTDSRGDGFFKRVAIVLRSEADEADEAVDESQPAQEP